MQFSDNFKIPNLEEISSPELISSKKATEQAFYAAGAYGNDDIVEQYTNIYEELTQRGTSTLLQDAQKKWETEQNEMNKDIMINIVGDKELSFDQKRSILNNYVSTGFISKDLQEKFIQRIGAANAADTYTQQQSQEDYINIIPEQLKLSDREQVTQAVARAETTFPEYFGGGALAGLEILKAIPAGVWGIWTMAAEQSPIEGKKAMEGLLDKWSSSAENPNVEKVKKDLLEAASVLGVPARLIQNSLYDLGVSAGGSIVGGVVLDPLNIPIISGLSAISKGIPSIKPGSQTDILVKSNPKLAADYVEDALKNPNSEAVKALGTDVPSLLTAFVLPKDSFDLKSYPSLHEKIIALDKRVGEVISEQFYDPTIQNATLRLNENSKVYDIVNNHGFSYMQSLSTLSPTKGNVWEGRAVFGRDNDYLFYSRTAAINSYEQVAKAVSTLPKELQGSVSIVDRFTGKKYTPEELMKDPKFLSKEQVMTTLPDNYEGIPIKYGKVTDESGLEVISSSGKPSKGRLWKDEFGLPKEIVVDVEAIKKDYKNLKASLKKEIESPEEYVRFVLEHEITHAKNPRKEGMTDLQYEASVNRIALDSLKALKASSSAGTKAKQFSIDWEWKREYDDLNIALFGPDSIKGDFFGIPTPELSRSFLGRHIWGPGRFPTWFEKSAARIAPRIARELSVFMDIARKDIANTPHKKEMADLVNEAEKLGKEHYTVTELQKKYPYLKEAQIESLFETHTYWRRVIHYLHTMVNIQFRDDLLAEGFNRSLEAGGKKIAFVTENFKFDSQLEAPRFVWDHELNIPIKFTLDIRKTDGVYDIGGKKLVRHRKPIEEDKNKYSYSLIDGTNSKLNLLPDEVVPRIPGYSPHKTEGHFFVRAIPTQVMLDGISITDPVRLEAAFKETKGVAKTEFDAQALKKEFENDPEYVDYVFKVTPDRSESFGRIMDDYEAHTNMLKNAKQRGGGLRAVNNGVVEIEDRLKTLVQTIQSLVSQGKFEVWERATKEAFLSAYSEYLPKGVFPNTLNDIEPLLDMDKTQNIKFKEAREVYKHYAKLKSFETLGDRLWSGVFTAVADTFEKFKIPASAIRTLAKEQNLVVEGPRKLATLSYITLNPQRQWIIQPSQLYEYYLMNPTNMVQNYMDLAAVKAAFIGESPLLGKTGPAFKDIASKLSISMDEAEFNATIKGIKQSGLLEGIDLNMLVHDVFDNVDRGFMETSWEAAYNNIVALPKAVTKISRKVGFDATERFNRVGLWLLAKNKWKERNPNKDWTTKEAIEDISWDEYRLSGSMTRAGSYPYQSGAASILLQFAAITQKQTMNLFSASATALTAKDRFKLAIARTFLWGAHYGTPGGPLVYHYIDQTDNEDIRKAADVLRRGIFDRAFSNLLGSIFNEEEVRVSPVTAMTPYGDVTGLGFAYLDLISTAYEFWQKGKHGARFPAVNAVGSVFEALSQMDTWFTTSELTPETATNILFEGLELASGWSNINKAIIMATTGELYNKSNVIVVDNATYSEALAKAFGIRSEKEIINYEIAGAWKDRRDRLNAIAKDLHQSMVNLKQKDGLGDTMEATEQRLLKLNKTLTLLKDGKNITDTDLEYIVTKYLQLEKEEYESMGSSMLSDYFKQGSDKQSSELNFIENKNRYLYQNDPKVIEMLDYIKGKHNG